MTDDSEQERWSDEELAETLDDIAYQLVEPDQPVLREAARRLRGGEGEREPTYVHRDDGWIIEEYENVHLASCPDCAFSFDAGHIDTLAREKGEDTYSCPACAEREMGPEGGEVNPPTQEEPHWRAYDEMTEAERRRNRQELSQEGQGRDKWYKRYVTDPEFHAWVDRVVNRACELERDRLRGAPEGAGGGELASLMEKAASAIEDPSGFIQTGDPSALAGELQWQADRLRPDVSDAHPDDCRCGHALEDHSITDDRTPPIYACDICDCYDFRDRPEVTGE